jgi:5-methylcytosine-specific restriction endonuclease McrA
MAVIEIQSIKCGSTNPQVIRAAAEFPQKLFEVHGDKIRIRDSAVYFGDGTNPSSKGKGIDVSCSICGNEWSPSANGLLKGHGCHECTRLNSINSAGKTRAPRASKEEHARAVELKATGMTLDAVAQQLFDEGLSPQLRGKGTIVRWTNPEQAEKDRQRAAKWNEENREQMNASRSRYQKEFDHGVAGTRAHSAQRRLLKQNTPESVFLGGEWHEVDREETWRVFGEVLLPAKERKEIQELYLEAQYQTETTGIEHHVDHIQPLSKGGEHLMYNLQILPASENLSKNDTFREEDQLELARRLFG